MMLLKSFHLRQIFQQDINYFGCSNLIQLSNSTIFISRDLRSVLANNYNCLVVYDNSNEVIAYIIYKNTRDECDIIEILDIFIEKKFYSRDMVISIINLLKKRFKEYNRKISCIHLELSHDVIVNSTRSALVEMSDHYEGFEFCIDI